MSETCTTGPYRAASEEYWRRIFKGNPEFCSWREPKQRPVLDLVRARLREVAGPLRVLDFGVGSLGLYRALEDDELLQRILLTGISESQQHDPADPLLARYHIHIELGPGLSPLLRVPVGSQNYVVCSYVFAYLSVPARAEALAAFARALSADGKLVLVLHHARGERARKFQSSEPYWHQARELYAQLLLGHYSAASALLTELDEMRNARFGRDPGYQCYLASYLKTAARILGLCCVQGQPVRPIPALASRDCEEIGLAIERELAMTCRSFHPVQNPATELALPTELELSSIIECLDPTSDAPMAHVLTAVKRRH